jgi:c-di-GMP-binding flagellar brake protein YcgR
MTSSALPPDPTTEFAPTMPLLRGVEAETQALVAGDLGDPSYRIDSFAESLDLMRKVEQSGLAVTMVVMNLRAGDAPEVALAFSSRILHVSDDTQTMEMDLPLASPPLPKGQTLRGSIRLLGVIVTFEAETLGSRLQPNGAQVLHARLPFRLYRLQRRDSFRVPVPSSSGVFITLKTGMRYLENLKALDLSCGGVSVLVRATVDSVHLGKRFPAALVRLGGPAGTENYQVDMLVRHVRMAPPGLNQMLASSPALRPPVPPRQGSNAFRESAMAAVGALLQPELLQLGIEFERMPMALERSLARLVNELGVNLVTRVKSDE